jgi:serine/threonine protein kinase
MAHKQDIITAIKNLDLFLRIPELKGAKPRLNNNGSPFAFAGGFNMVFQLVHNAKKWAFRVWHIPIGENKDRYVAISKYLTNSKLPYFADFVYDENGLLVNGELTDTIRMEWLDGILLKDYIEKHLNDKAKLESLANDFLEMTKTLREAKISHGDLQEGNILVDDSGKIRLVDYDSICIPEIEGQKELVTGLKGYQHPSRFKNSKASLKADYFSELIIYICILGIASKPELWDKYQVKDTISLNNGIGNVIGKKSISISPNQTNKYKLTAENAFGKTEEEITINVLPLPKIKEFRSKP